MSDGNEAYLRNDVFNMFIERTDAMMASMKAHQEASEARFAAQIAENNARLEVYRADSRRESESLAADIKAINERFDRMERASARRWTVAGVVIAFFGAMLGVIPYIPVIKSVLGW